MPSRRRSSKQDIAKARESLAQKFASGEPIKSTQATKAARVAEIYRMLAHGATRDDVLQHAARNDWGVRTRMIDNYIAAARKQQDADLAEYRKTIVPEHVAALREARAMAFKDGDMRAVTRSLEREAKLLGLDEGGNTGAPASNPSDLENSSDTALHALLVHLIQDAREKGLDPLT